MISTHQHVDVASYLRRAKSARFPRVQGVNSTPSHELGNLHAGHLLEGKKNNRDSLAEFRLTHSSLPHHHGEGQVGHTPDTHPQHSRRMRDEVIVWPERTEDGTAVVCMLQGGVGVGRKYGNIHAGDQKCTSEGQQHRSEGCRDALERKINKMAALKWLMNYSVKKIHINTTLRYNEN